MMISTKRRTRPIAATVLLSLALAACASTSDDDSASSSDPSTASTGPPIDSSTDTTTPAGAVTTGADTDASTDAGGVTTGADTDVTEPARRTLKIGYAYPDVAAFEILSDKFAIGDPEVQAASVLQGWRRDGTLPINGTDIELVFAKYNILSTDEQLGACTYLAQDEEVFAVIAGRDFKVGSQCLAERFQVPVIDASGLPESTYDLTAPWLFTVRASESQVLESFVQWADAQGAFDGKRIGVFWDTRSEEAVDAFKSALAEVGHEVVSDLPSDGEGIGSPQDSIVVQRFVTDDVDLAIMLVSTSSVTNFLASAEAQNYDPDLLWLEWANQLTDVSTQAYPQGLIDGVEAMSMSRLGEIAAGLPLAPQTQRCIDDYEVFSGEDVALISPESGVTNQTLYTCDLMALLLEGLRNAGDDPTRESFVASLETITNFPLALWSNLTFSADDHAGVEEVRTTRWSTQCECWTALDDFSDPLP